ncbi:response regulator [Lignipirellula cremea]|uniref:Transcriptional activator protein CopR n=1 Tax=Lignipirellula cremea TaxID=2528010 RepID=A0A518E3M3_9BACT|nr:response regulator transcription factor [Lignipirellula cremea]QDU98695.1 Transcriptional activator protein CopR [Lignipirellula cremea]
MRILVVEDYAPLREAVAQGLREAGFAVDAAVDGTEGWWHAEATDYDVIVLDLMLPGIDGLTILKKLRAINRRSCVLILTAKDQLENRVEGLNLGADDYLIKPFAFDELLARVRTLVRRRYDQRDPVLRIGDLEVNTAAQTVRRGSRHIELTAREYALLEYLAVRAGEPVSRTHIWEHVYDFHSDSQSNVVDVYIGYLRRKIESDELPRLIHTKRGQGYMLGDLS